MVPLRWAITPSVLSGKHSGKALLSDRRQGELAARSVLAVRSPWAVRCWPRGVSPRPAPLRA